MEYGVFIYVSYMLVQRTGNADFQDVNELLIEFLRDRQSL